MRKRRLLPLFFVLTTVSLGASIGMSVAWYANGAYLRTSNVDVSLMSDPELGLSLVESYDINNYHFGEFPYEELPKMKSGYSDDFSDEQETNINGFVPVSSMYSCDWIGQRDSEGNLLDPVFCSNYKRASLGQPESYLKTVAAKSGFYSVPLYMICDHDMYVSIDPDGTTITPDAKTNLETAKEICSRDFKRDIDQTKRELDAIVNSVRLSIYDCDSHEYWIIDPNKSNDPTYFAGPLDLDSNQIYDFYYDENDILKEYMFGEYQDPSNVVYKKSDGSSPMERYDTFNAKHLEGVQMVDMEYYIENDLLEKEKSYTPLELSKMDLIALTNHTPHRIVLSIYIEGWDRDNTAVSSQGSFFASIKFKLTRPNYSN